MYRMAIVFGTFAVGCVLAVGQAAPKAAAPVPPKEAAKPRVQSPSERLLTLLHTAQSVFDEQPADPQTTLGKLLDAFSKKFSRPGDDPPLTLSFEIDANAFKADGITDLADYQIIKEKAFPKKIDITIDRYLRKWLELVPAKSGATFIVRKDHVEITTNMALRAQIWGDHPGPFLPLVHAAFEKKPLEDAFKELAELTEHNIILDVRAGEKAKTLVTARFANTPLDSAVAFLADMADLQPILQDNAIYVTTRDNALRWEARNKKEMPAEDPNLPRIGRIGTGVRGFPRPAPKKENSGKKSSSLPSRHPLLHLVMAAPVPGKEKPETGDSAAQKLRKELNVAVSAEFAALPLPQAIAQLKEKTGVDFVLDRAVLEMYFQERNPAGNGMEGVLVTAKLNKTPLRRGLRNILSEYDLGFVIVGEQVLITTQAMAPARQMRQVIGVDVDKVPAAEALKKLAREAGVNLVLDSRAAKEVQEKVSLQLDEVALDTAVKLLAEQAGLKAVFVDNVVFVTTKARALEMRDDPDFKPRDPGEGRVFPDGKFAPGGPGGMGAGGHGSKQALFR